MKKILLGMPIWGEQYIRLFMDYCLPSLMTEANLPTLCKEYEVTLNVHTKKEDRHFLKEIPLLIPNINLYSVEPLEDKYQTLGQCQHKDLEYAKMVGADYHCLMPDHVYSKNCFSNMLRLVERGHKAIARVCVSTNAETICPALDVYRNGRILSIPASDLATLSLLHIHRGIRGWLATKEDYPNTHIIAWPAKDTLHIHSPHQTPVYIAHEAIALDVSDKPLDNVLDKIVDGSIYCTRPEDGLVMLEIAPELGREINDKRVDLKEFCRIFKSASDDSAKQLEIFDQGMIDPINREQVPAEFWNDIEILNEKSKIVKAIKEF